MFFLELIALTFALSIDSFVTGIVYGAGKVQIPFKSTIIINITCCGILGLLLFLGQFIGDYIPEKLAVIVCSIILICLGLIKLLDQAIKRIIKKQSAIKILEIYVEPEKADINNSKILGPGEALLLAIALSFDGAAVGFGAGIAAENIGYNLLIIGVSFVLGMSLILLGQYIGKKMMKSSKVDLSWISGFLLITLGLLKLF